MKGKEETINQKDSYVVCAERQERRKEGMPLGMFGSLKEAAEKIISDFGLTYNNTGYAEGVRKPIAAKRSEYQIWAEKKQELFAHLSRLHEQLREMKMRYAPKDREDSNWNPLFVLAETEFTYVDYLYDYCMFEAAEEELKQKYEEITKEMERIEKRIYDTKSGIRGSDAGQVGEGMAV